MICVLSHVYILVALAGREVKFFGPERFFIIYNLFLFTLMNNSQMAAFYCFIIGPAALYEVSSFNKVQPLSY